MVSRKLASALKKAKDMGRGGDTMLAHINPSEAKVLKSLGGSGTINPHTGLPQFDNPSMGAYDAPSSSGGSSYSNYTGGSDLGGYSGSGNTTYSGNYGGGGDGGTDSMAAARTADRQSIFNYSSDPYSTNSYVMGSMDNQTPYNPMGPAGLSGYMVRGVLDGASGLASALNAGAGKVSNVATSFSDSLNGILSDAQPAVSSLGNRVADNMISMSDTLNANLTNGYNYAKDYINNALSPSAPQGPSYTQMAALSGPPDLGQGAESAVSNPPVSSSFPSIAPDWADPNSYMGGSRLVGYGGTGGSVYENFGNINDTPAPTRAPMREFLDRQNANLPAATATPSTTSVINPDVSYGLRFNPSTVANAEYIKGAQIKDQFPNVGFGDLSNTEIGRVVTRTIAGEAASEGPLGQQLVGTNIMNRLSLANQGIGLAGNFGPNASFKEIMKGYDANGFDSKRVGPANSVYNSPDSKTEWDAFNAMSAALSPNAAINQARTNPMAAMELGAQYGVSPELIANGVQSTHYYNPKYASPSWGPKMANTAQIGGHLFGNLNATPNATTAMNSAMTGYNIPSAAPQQTSQVTPAPFPQDYSVDAQKLVDDIFKNTTGASLVYSKDSLINEFVKADPENVTYDPNTDQLSIRLTDTNKDGTVDQTDYDAVIQGIKAKSNEKVDPNAYTTALGPPTQQNVAPNSIMANMGIVQPPAETPVSPMMQQVASNTSTVPHLGGYDAPIGVDPNGYASPLYLPAQPNTALGTAFDTAIGLTPMGIPNTIAHLFGSSAGDILANQANVPVSPEDAAAMELAQYASSGSDNGGRDNTRTAESLVDRAKTLMSSITKTDTAWKQAARNFGYSEAQLNDPETSALIKQIYDMGFIPTA